MLIRLMTAIALAASLAACATAGPAPVVAAASPPPAAHTGRAPIEEAPLIETGLLAELPANAPPGECYARVGVPSGPAAPPPPVAQATWVQTAGPPGSPGPIWCLVPVCQQCVSAPPPAPEMKYGWIRVICEKDLTVDRIRKVQTRLHDRGYYQGPVTGSYDQTTATAVSRFQEQAHISHGGYLSIQTVEALESNAAYAPPPVTQVALSASATGNASASASVGAAPPVVAYGQQYGQSAQVSQYSSQYGGYSATYGAGAYPQVQTYPPVAYGQPQYMPPQYGQPQYAAPQYAPQYPPMAYPQPAMPQVAYGGYPQAGYPPMAYPQPGYGYPQQAPYGGVAVAAAAAAAASGGGGNYGVQYGGRGLPEPAYRGRTAVQDGFLTWPSKQAFY